MSDTGGGGDHRKPPESPLGSIIFRGLAVLMGLLLAYNIWADINVAGYEGYGTTVLLGPIVGGLLGFGEWLKKR